MPNDLRFVRDVLSRLEADGLEVWLAGGWAEELHGLIRPRPHHDVDLLFRGASFEPLDAFLETGAVTEIAAKRFAHKRAFELDGTMVELILVEPDLTTNFWGSHRYAWPEDTFAGSETWPRLASIAGLDRFRRHRPPSWEEMGSPAGASS